MNKAYLNSNQLFLIQRNFLFFIIDSCAFFCSLSLSLRLFFSPWGREEIISVINRFVLFSSPKYISRDFSTSLACTLERTKETWNWKRRLSFLCIEKLLTSSTEGWAQRNSTSKVKHWRATTISCFYLLYQFSFSWGTYKWNWNGLIFLCRIISKTRYLWIETFYQKYLEILEIIYFSFNVCSVMWIYCFSTNMLSTLTEKKK